MLKNFFACSRINNQNDYLGMVKIPLMQSTRKGNSVAIHNHNKIQYFHENNLNILLFTQKSKFHSNKCVLLSEVS
jgi:hypothetical protein